MIDITKAQGNQTTFQDGTLSDWTITLGDEQLCSLPSHLSPEEFFHIRDVIHELMLRAAKDAREVEKRIAESKIAQILETGNRQLDFLKEENEKLAKFVDEQTKKVA